MVKTNISCGGWGNLQTTTTPLQHPVVFFILFQTEGLRRDIVDLQSEFEFDRIDYLDSIRKQERQLQLVQALVDKIHPCVRRDSNYCNLDKIRAECKWDEAEQRWVLPQLTIEKTTLPSAGNFLHYWGTMLSLFNTVIL
jgi:hypothetical protein